MTDLEQTTHRRSHRRRRPLTAAVPPERGSVATLNAVAEGLLYALLAFSPFAFGVVAAWSREVFLLLVAAAAVVVATKHVVAARTGRPVGYRWSWVYVLALAFVALCAAQAVSLPSAWVSHVSPGTVGLRSELLRDLPADALRRMPISFYPHRTVEQVALVAAVAVVFAVVVDLFREPARIRRLLTTVVVVGLGVAGLSAYQHLTGATKVYGVVAMAHPDVGPFMNYSHFSQFVNMSVGAAVALLLDRLATLAADCRSPRALWAAVNQPRNAVVWVYAALCVLGPLMVLLSLSRMGMLSLFATTVATAGMLAWRGRSTALAPVAAGGLAWVLVGFALVVFAALLFLRFEAVAAKLATVPTYENTDTRTEILRDLLPAYRRFPVAGTGLGSFEFVFGLYDHRNWSTIATHAENEYAQLMLETGLAGLLLAAGFVALVAAKYVRATRRPVDPIDLVPFGLGFGLLAVLIHSCSDFGQHLPANAALTATFAALMTTFARRQRGGSPPSGRRSVTAVGRPLPTLGRWAALGGVGVATVAAGLWADRARAAESLWSVGQARGDALSANHWQASQAAYADVLGPTSAAAGLEPGDVEYRYWTDVCRWYALSPKTDPATGRDVLPPGGVAAARQIAADLDAVRVLCPTYGSPMCVAGQIDRDLLGQVDRGNWEIRTSARLAPYNFTTCLVAGINALEGKRPSEAATLLAHYVALGGGMGQVSDACLHYGAPEIAYRMVEHDAVGMADLADRMPAGDPRWATWLAHCRRKAATLLAAEAARADARPEELAAQAAADQSAGRPAEAVGLYRRAVQADFGNLAWRASLARSLATLGRYDEASTELRVCVRLHPDATDLRDLLAEYRLKASRPAATAP